MLLLCGHNWYCGIEILYNVVIICFCFVIENYCVQTDDENIEFLHELICIAVCEFFEMSMKEKLAKKKRNKI